LYDQPERGNGLIVNNLSGVRKSTFVEKLMSRCIQRCGLSGSTLIFSRSLKTQLNTVSILIGPRRINIAARQIPVALPLASRTAGRLSPRYFRKLLSGSSGSNRMVYLCSKTIKRAFMGRIYLQITSRPEA
jgi:hypothetical protein